MSRKINCRGHGTFSSRGGTPRLEKFHGRDNLARHQVWKRHLSPSRFKSQAQDLANCDLDSLLITEYSMPPYEQKGRCSCGYAAKQHLGGVISPQKLIFYVFICRLSEIRQNRPRPQLFDGKLDMECFVSPQFAKWWETKCFVGQGKKRNIGIGAKNDAAGRQ